MSDARRYAAWPDPRSRSRALQSRKSSPFPYVFSFRIFGDLENYTFLERLGPTESGHFQTLSSRPFTMGAGN